MHTDLNFSNYLFNVWKQGLHITECIDERRNHLRQDRLVYIECARLWIGSKWIFIRLDLRLFDLNKYSFWSYRNSNCFPIALALIFMGSSATLFHISYWPLVILIRSISAFRRYTPSEKTLSIHFFRDCSYITLKFAHLSLEHTNTSLGVYCLW